MNTPFIYTLNRVLKVLGLNLAWLSLASCLFQPAGTVPQLDVEIAELGLKSQYYSFTAWVDEDTVAFIYSNLLDDVQEEILLYNLRTHDSKTIPIALPDECDAARLLRLSRLTLGQAAVILECYFHNKPGEQFADRIVVWDTARESEWTLHQYPSSFRASDFAFAPDLSEGLQEHMGDGIFNQLYRVDEAGNLARLLPDYYRVGAPDWSEDGAQIAFAATPNSPKERNSVFTGLVAIDNALAQPWTIYVANPDLSMMEAVLDQIIGIRQLSWSPDGNYLAFNAAKYGRRPGIFILNLQDATVVQVWDEDTEFDWSPSGQQMIVLDYQEEEQQESLRKPIILDVSALYAKEKSTN